MNIPGKLLTNNSLLQLFWQVTKADVAHVKNYAPGIIKKARGKIRQWQSEYENGYFETREQELTSLPTRLQGKIWQSLPESYVFKFLIARGAPLISGMTIERPIYDEYSFDLSMNSAFQKKDTACSLDFFLLNAAYLARKQRLPPPCLGHLSCAFNKWAAGHKLRLFSVRKAPQVKPTPLLLDTESSGDCLILEIHDPSFLIADQRRSELLKFIDKKIEGLKKSAEVDLNTEIFKKNVSLYARDFTLLRFGLPLCIPMGYVKIHRRATKSTPKSSGNSAAFRQPMTKVASKSKSQESGIETGSSSGKATASAPPVSKKSPTASPAASAPAVSKKKPHEEPYPGKGLLKINVSEDKLHCSVIEFQQKWYENLELDLNDHWLELEMCRLGITARSKELLSRVLDNLNRKRDVNALRLAEGDPGSPPEDPVLTPVKEQDTAQENPEGEKTLDFRKSRIKSVKKGQMIAFFKFQNEGREGKDIFGKSLPIPPPEPISLNNEGGVEMREDFSLYALMDGICRIDTNSFTVAVEKSLVIEGDVSLATGNIVFDGTILIQGGIRDGASVRATDSIIVEQGVANATITCGANLEVADGVIKSQINCKGDVKAGFIENSRLMVEGKLASSRAIVNCQVTAKDIEVFGEPGMIGGGTIFCNQHLSALQIGLSANHPTAVTMGVSWHLSKQIARYEGRQSSFEMRQEEWQKSLALLEKKSAAQRTKAQQETISDLKSKLKKIGKILKKISVKLRNFKSEITDSNDEAQITATNLLLSNVDIKMGKQEIKRLGDSAGVYITARPKRGKYIHAIEDEQAS